VRDSGNVNGIRGLNSVLTGKRDWPKFRDRSEIGKEKDIREALIEVPDAGFS